MVHPQPIDKEIGGIPLLVAGASAIVNHFLRAQSKEDPLQEINA